MRGGTSMLASTCLGLVFIGLYAQIDVGSQKLSIEIDSQEIGTYDIVPTTPLAEEELLAIFCDTNVHLILTR